MTRRHPRWGRSPLPQLPAGPRTTAQRTSSSEEVERTDNFEYVRALRLGGRRYALEVDEDGALLRAQTDELKRESLLWMLAGLLVAIPVFFLVGGVLQVCTGYIKM